MIANGIICFMFGMGAGMAISMIVMCVGSSNHEEEAYQDGYAKGHLDGLHEGRILFSGRERTDE